MDYSMIHSYKTFGRYGAIWGFIQRQAAYIIKTQVYRGKGPLGSATATSALTRSRRSRVGRRAARLGASQFLWSCSVP